MKHNNQLEKFEIGTSSLFIGLSFVTLVPYLMRLFLIFVDPNVYRFFGGFFIVLSVIFYSISPAFYKKQMVNLGIGFILFAVSQFLISSLVTNITVLAKYFSLLIGIFLLITGYYLEKTQAD